MVSLAQGAPEAPELVPSAPTVITPDVGGPGGAQEGLLQPFLDSDLFSMVQALGSVTGGVVMVVVVFYVIRNITQGAFALAVRTGVFGAIVAAMLFNLRVPISFAQGLTTLVDQIFSFLLDIVNRNGS